jgi:site-specific DNA-methyltransferase (adenine-specific)
MFKKGESLTLSSKTLNEENLEDANNIIVGFSKGYLFAKKSASLGEIYDNGLVKTLLKSGHLNLIKDVSYINSQLDKNFTWSETQRTWTLNKRKPKNQLLLFDNLEVMKSIASDTFDACITDPPYNISGYDHKKEIGWYKSSPYWKEYKKFNKINESWDKFSDKGYLQYTKDWLSEASRIVKPNGNIIIFGSLHNIYKLGFVLEEMELKVLNSIVWYKRNAFPNITNRMLCESTEHIVCVTNNNKKDARNWTFNYKILKELNNGKQMRNMWDIPSTPISEKKLGKHPAQKSKEVVKRLVLGFTKEKDVVLDPFMGAGTIPLVCKEYERNYFGIEKEPEYFLTSHRRLKNYNKVLKLPT